MEPSVDRRFPRRIYGRGDEPDPRFSLANERTYLAWIRTSLALVATGVALEALALPIQEGLRFAASTVFVALGLLAVVHAWFSWAHTESALRANRALSGVSTGFILTVGLVCAIALVVIGLLLP
jgi:putative membrane protein